MLGLRDVREGERVTSRLVLDLKVVVEEGGSGGASGEVEDGGDVEAVGSSGSPWLDEVVEEEIRMQVHEDLGEGRLGEVERGLESRHEMGGEVLGGVEMRF